MPNIFADIGRSGVAAVGQDLLNRAVDIRREEAGFAAQNLGMAIDIEKFKQERQTNQLSIEQQQMQLEDQKAVDDFLPPYNPPHPLDPTKPINHGPQIFPDQGSAINVQRAVAFDDVEAVIEEVVADYNKAFGRKYSPFVDEYMMDDADIAFFIQGGHARTARFAVNHLRKQGVKAGVARLRFMRPFPTAAVAASLSKVKAVGTVETSTSYGGASRGGNLIHEARTACYNLDNRPIITSFMAGLGGEIVTLNEFYAMAKVLSDAVKSGKANNSYWMNFEKEVLDTHS